MNIIKPQRLKYGDTIGIIAPCIAPEPGQFDKPIEILESKGFKVKLSKNVYKRTYEYAASPEERADDFNNMISDKEVKAVLFEGGYVSNEMLPLLDYENIKRNPKILSSYSDSTTLLDVITTKTGLVTFYGFSLSSLYPFYDYNYRQFENTVMNNENRVFEHNSKWQTINGGKCEGILIGGYIINLALLMDGKFFDYKKDKKYILLVEDFKDFNPMAYISMYLSHIDQSSFMDNVSGIIFGDYGAESKDLNDILERLSKKRSIPCIRCDDFGHGRNHASIPMGISAALDADKQQLIYSEAGVE